MTPRTVPTTLTATALTGVLLLTSCGGPAEDEAVEDERLTSSEEAEEEQNEDTEENDDEGSGDADSTADAKVTVVATGGTIAGQADERDGYTSYRAGTYEMEDMLEVLEPEVSGIADVDVIQFGNAGSSGYTIEEFHELTLTVEDALEDSDAVVVTTGTDTQEEFAYWLDLTVQSRKPVITTGAMRPWAVGEEADEDLILGADGPANLLQAIRLAASQETYCYGTVLMLNDEIHAAREVTKGSTTRMDTFETRMNGVLGWIDGEDVLLQRLNSRAAGCEDDSWFTPFDLSEIDANDLPQVEISYAYQDASGAGVEALIEEGAEGIVTAGTGAGGFGAGVGEVLEEHDDVWVALSSRTGSGTVELGGENMIPAGDLLPQKARLLLILSLAATDDVDQAHEWFAEIGNPQAGLADLSDSVSAVSGN